MTGPEPNPPIDPAPRVEAATRGPIVVVERIALGLTIVCGLAAWGVGVRTFGYDYDEVTRAHSVWLASQGLRPYADFFEVHPPYFRLLVPVIAAGSHPLLALRVFASVGNLLFVGGLGVLGASLVGKDARRWAWLGVALVAFHPAVLAFLVEFRIDGWGYALATWSLVRYRRRPPGWSREGELGLVTGIATLWFSPKLTILPALVVGMSQWGPGGSLRQALRGVAAYGGGVAVAVALFLGFLAVQGIGWGQMAQLLIRYHMISGANAGFHLGLLGAILPNRLLLGLILAGVVTRGIITGWRRTGPGAFEVALLIWLAIQAVLVAYPYKQYFAPWFLFAAVYLGFLGSGSLWWWRRVRLLPFLAACGFTGFGAVQAAEGWFAGDEAHAQERVIHWMNQVTDPTDRVVASPPLHPIERYDTFFAWLNTADPSGFDTGQILARLPDYRAEVMPERLRAELEAHPPALVFLSGDWRVVAYPEGQQRALSAFLPRHGYRTITHGPLRFAVRPDRLDRARQPE